MLLENLQRMFLNLLHPAVEPCEWADEARMENGAKEKRGRKLCHSRKSEGHQLHKTQHVL